MRGVKCKKKYIFEIVFFKRQRIRVSLAVQLEGRKPLEL